MRLVLFDIDGTLVPGASSELRFARFLWRKQELGLRQLLAFTGFGILCLPRYGRQVLQKNKAYLSGHACARIHELARAFVAGELLDALYRPALERLRTHQAAGDHVVFLSGTPQFLVAALAVALGVPAGAGAQCDVRGQRFTARAPRSHPHGPSKIDAGRQLARASGLALSQAIAYGNSINDAYLFRVVGEVVAVQPDRQLSAAASGAGWEILFDRADRV